MDLVLALIAKLASGARCYKELLLSIHEADSFHICLAMLFLKYKTGIYWPQSRNDFRDPDAVSAAETLSQIELDIIETHRTLVEAAETFHQRNKLQKDKKRLEQEFLNEVSVLRSSLREQLVRLTWMAGEASRLPSSNSLPKETEIIYSTRLITAKTTHLRIHLGKIIHLMPKSSNKTWRARFYGILDEERLTAAALGRKNLWPYSAEANETKSKVAEKLSQLLRDIHRNYSA